jgi:hypothetical protein
MEILHFIEAVTEYNSYTEARNTRTLSKTKTTEIKLSWQETIQLPLPKPANLKHPGIELPKATSYKLE